MPASIKNRVVLARLAGALFVLAGLIEVAVGWATLYKAITAAESAQGGEILSAGALFLAVGALWIAVAFR